MNALRQSTNERHFSIIEMARTGQLLQLHKIDIACTEDIESPAVRTEIAATAITATGNLGFPIFVVENHENDDKAMKHLLDLFDAMRLCGKATSEQVASWRRKLIVEIK